MESGLFMLIISPEICASLLSPFFCIMKVPHSYQAACRSGAVWVSLFYFKGDNRMFSSSFFSLTLSTFLHSWIVFTPRIVLPRQLAPKSTTFRGALLRVWQIYTRLCSVPLDWGRKIRRFYSSPFHSNKLPREDC